MTFPLWVRLLCLPDDLPHLLLDLQVAFLPLRVDISIVAIRLDLLLDLFVICFQLRVLLEVVGQV